MFIPLNEGITMKLVRIPAGDWVMGEPEDTPDEPSLSRVTIARPFWMAACEISNEQFRRFDASHDSRYYQKRYPAAASDSCGLTLNDDRQPVVRVSWDEAMSFCRWLSARTGLHFSLPTEAQWEWACRAGTSTPFSFGARDTDFAPWANLADASFGQGLGKDGKQVTGGLEHLVLEGAALSDVRFNDRTVVTGEIGSFQPNDWGMHDLHGNAAEWTCDEAPGGLKIVRGGSFYDPPRRASSSFRLAYPSWQRVFNVGFRVICEEGKMMGAK
jgi:formylglycine-generating enzyme required for sulfatase activity